MSDPNGTQAGGAGPALSVITALAARREHRLSEIHAVLAASRVSWEWLIQLDGERGTELPAEVLADPRTRVERNGRQLGIATTRNRALSRAAAPLLLNVDSDDVPTGARCPSCRPRSMTRRSGSRSATGSSTGPTAIRGLRKCASIPVGWSPARCRASGRRSGWVPLHLAGAMWRTDAVLAAGGWSATVGGADIGLLLGVDAGWASVYVPVTTFTYHHHGEQVTASDEYRAQFELDMRFLERRQQALDRLSRRSRTGR